ncbi:tryptophanase [Natranaerobius thermophilus]|uniref:Tyrosine phenol-lyase n=1 Tax=Natranaerobius thermophilus (strain ATCC BAA-1301 / DSM 18059 / JW/NM-WN-LF) TaxID=457570 RepID=B2A6Z8_NATTJ|nr:tryptophanase [Natranaerobius thermophilus]ACB85589.1 tyrosine phenol-lyase [Natranaerobius thermophilus JW/NM-WN-LF]
MGNIIDEMMAAEPFRIKMVEPIKTTTKEERQRKIKEAGYNVFNLESKDVYIDLLTDSGTSAMSDNQWAGMMLGDEAYAGSKNFYNLKDAIKEVMGYDYFLPTHQGRAAENVLFQLYVEEGNYVPNNMHFDTTKAHVQDKRGRPVNLVIDEAYDAKKNVPFKGNMDIDKLDNFLKEHSDNVPIVLLTVTCNSGGGQPVSMENIKEVSEICKKYNKPFYLDACRFAENAYFIKLREPGYADKSIPEITREMFSYADGCTMSSKKDALVNIGGFLAMEDEKLLDKAKVLGVLYEGFPTYGGMAGRDMEAMARGLLEVVEEEYLQYRINQVNYLGEKLKEKKVPILEPVGGHAVYLDAGRFLPNIPKDQFPGQALTVALYEEGGIRGVEIGTVLSGRDPETGDHDYPELELVRLTIPRRVYTYRHMDVVAEAAKIIHDKRDEIGGYKFTYEPEILRHFTARFAPVK